MNIHEFQAKEILKRFGVAVPQGIIATTAEEAKAAAQQMGGGVVVVKAQIHAGGRGKGGGGQGAPDAWQKSRDAPDRAGGPASPPRSGGAGFRDPTGALSRDGYGPRAVTSHSHLLVRRRR